MPALLPYQQDQLARLLNQLAGTPKPIREAFLAEVRKKYPQVP